MSSEKIPFSKPELGEEEIAEVADTLRSGWLTTGPKTKRFEESFAAYVGAPFALGTSSCTGALHLALAALGIGPGDEVITSTLTFAATANVIVHCGATPVFADVDARALTVDPAEIAARITPRTRAVIAVHYAGLPCDMDGIARLCQPRGIRIVEDAAHAVGAAYHGRAVGSLGDAAAFSFYANKNLTTGEGGMLTTPHADVHARARVLRLQGMTRDLLHRETDTGAGPLPSWRYEIVAAGFKYPMADIHAAIGIHQLRKLPAFQAARRRVAERYSAELEGIPGLQLPAMGAADVVHAWHLYTARVGSAARLDRDALFTALQRRGIECSVHFVPLHLQPYFQSTWGTRAGQFPRAEAAFSELLSLPLFPSLEGEAQTRVIAALRELLG